jgi:hypothetical protein
MHTISNMSLRFVRAVLVGFLLLQCGLLAPAAMALDAGQDMADCAGHSGTGGNDSPCCPQGVSTSAGCASICLGAFAGMIDSTSTIAHLTNPAVPGIPSSFLAGQTYAPVNPPPIV